MHLRFFAGSFDWKFCSQEKSAEAMIFPQHTSSSSFLFLSSYPPARAYVVPISFSKIWNINITTHLKKLRLGTWKSGGYHPMGSPFFEESPYQYRSNRQKTFFWVNEMVLRKDGVGVYLFQGIVHRVGWKHHGYWTLWYFPPSRIWMSHDEFEVNVSEIIIAVNK